MLLPQIRQSVRRSVVSPSAILALKAISISILRPSAAHLQSRSFWWGRSNDWISPADPTYQRFHRIRTLRTRAKLLDKIRRRGKFEWDVNQRPFFTPKQIRWASHWNYDQGKRRWYNNDEPSEKKDEDKPEANEEGYELNQREKIWKEQMEKLRKRIEHDPYEAIFGKRFEPFWSPLVPSWMREEMGLQGWPKQKEARQSAPESSANKEAVQRSNAEKTKDHQPSETNQVQAEAAVDRKPSSETKSYSYASSTSWDSWTKKTRRTEWDSVSNQTKEFEYDPISNRMIQVRAGKVAESPQIAGAKDNSATKSSNTGGIQIPIKQSTDVRKSIPIPQPVSQPSRSIPVAVAAPTSLGSVKSTAISSSPSKPAALAKLPAQDLDMLTADDVRASMGKTRPSSEMAKTSSPQEKAEMERDFERKVSAGDPEADAILTQRSLTKGKASTQSEWDQAEMGYVLDRELENLRKKKEKLLKHEQGLFHIEKQKRELEKLDSRIKDITAQLNKLNTSRQHSQQLSLPEQPEQKGISSAISLQRATAVLNSSSTESKPLQSSLERLQSKDQPKRADLDDSAAHESTESIEFSSTYVPREWSKQADMLQSDRVRRTSDRQPFPMRRWIDDMEARKAKYEAEKQKEETAIADHDAEKNSKLEKANGLLQAEVMEQKSRMQAHEGRYANKLRHMRQELETAYKQSTVHSEKHLERIQNLEEELAKAQKLVNENETTTKKSNKAYADKIQALRQELEIAYKQSTVHSEKHLEHIRYLEQQLAETRKTGSNESASTGEQSHTESMKIIQAEGDFCPNITKYAGSNKWYKKPAQGFPELSQYEVEKAKQKLRDQELVREVREIYEKAYGVIDTNHRQGLMLGEKKPSLSLKKPRQVVEVESDVDLGEELARYEKEKEQQPWRLQNESLSTGVPQIAKDKQTSPGDKVSANEGKPDALEPSVAWEEPPVYKVLAYDSGNDMFSTATTTSNVTGTETPISIQQALSQLYQPARFVPHFADLQKQGYQVIYGTKDLLVFKQVKSSQRTEVGTSEASEISKNAKAKPAMEDHGLIDVDLAKSSDPITTLLDKFRHDSSRAVNPVDGTRAPYTKPSTGNFASPTGFVNHDPVFPPEEATKDTESLSSIQNLRPGELEGQENEDEDIHYRHYPRVRRQEPHFTGTSTAASLGGAMTPTTTSCGSKRHWGANHRRHHARQESRDHRSKQRKRSRVAWVAKTAIGVAGLMYLVGAATEKARDKGKEDEWTRKAEEQRRRMLGKDNREGW